MIEYPQEPVRSTPGRRAAAFLGLVALVLLQVSSAAHQFEHSDDHGFGVCEACTPGNQLDDVLAPEPVGFDFAATARTTADPGKATAPAALRAAHFRSRAPPVS